MYLNEKGVISFPLKGLKIINSISGYKERENE